MTHGATTLWIDTDIGVDDAVAIAWLACQSDVRIVGISTVVGNTSVEDATRNILTLQDVIGQSIPVIIGASMPLELGAQRLGPSAFVHGPSGLWQAQRPQNLAGLPNDAASAIASAARANPDLVILALGPLTNIARALQLYPADLANMQIIALAGAKHGGNRTPVAEFNAYFDPHALAEVLARARNVTLIPLDAFQQLKVDSDVFPKQLAAHGGRLGQFLAEPLTQYFLAETQGQHQPVSIPDAVAAIYTLHPHYGEAIPALVEVVTDHIAARGQTIIATDVPSRVLLIAGEDDLAALAENAFNAQPFDLPAALSPILARRPDNTRVVLRIDAEMMRTALLRTLLDDGADPQGFGKAP